MLTVKQLTLLAGLLIAGNWGGYWLKTHRPEFFVLEFFNSPPNLILINTLVIILVLVVFNLISLVNLREDKKALYTDTTLIENIPSILCIKDKDGRWLVANKRYLDLLHLSGVSYRKKKDVELVLIAGCCVKELEANIFQDQQAWQKRRAIKENRLVSLGDAKHINIEITSTPIFNDKQEPLRLIISSENLQQNTELSLLNTWFDSNPISFALLNKKFKIERINQQFSHLTGHTIDEIRAKSIVFLNRKYANKTNAEIVQFFKENDSDQVWSKEVFCEVREGKSCVVKLEIKSACEEKDYYFATLVDITLQKQYKKRISQASYCDDLTGLTGRALYMEKLTQFLSNAAEHKQHAVICVLDLALFKSVNDSLGYNASEQILKEVAKRLSQLSKTSDIVSRLRGDEFALLMVNEESHEKAMFSASILMESILKSLARPFPIDDHDIVISASVGVAIFPEDGLNAELLMQNADLAMTQAKKMGGNQAQFYSKALLLEQQDRLALEQNLRKAMSRYELELFYQPQYSAKNKKLWGAEVLIRWTQDPQGKAIRVSPESFIPIAEETGLIIEIGGWILETACLQMKKWLDNKMPISQVSVNVSARQFMDKHFLESVESALKKSNLPAKHLEIELTETMLVGDPTKIELQLKRLNKMGIKIALDDFGTGYSSLSYLKKFPIDMLKIDQAFIREMTPDSKDAKLVKAIINMKINVISSKATILVVRCLFTR